MHNLRHFYYQNKEKVWKVMLIIAFILGIIYFLNDRAVEDANRNLNTINSNTIKYSDEQNKIYISNQSAVLGDTVTQETVKQINTTISKFLRYCKNGNTEEAYNMLSNACKEEGYSTLEQFKEKYLKSRFDKNSVFEIKKWMINTYKITISKDLLATGNIEDDEKIIEYITIVTENSEQKLNINSYIGKTNINKETTENKIKITAVSKQTYMDYEIYDLKIENLSNNIIKLDSLNKIGTIYLKDSNGIKYNAYINEILEDDIEIKSKERINVSIKFANTYTNTPEIEDIVFENVILDYLEYKNTSNKNNYKDIVKIEVNI